MVQPLKAWMKQSCEIKGGGQEMTQEDMITKMSRFTGF